jgi:hypothetical protein
MGHCCMFCILFPTALPSYLLCLYIAVKLHDDIKQFTLLTVKDIMKGRRYFFDMVQDR